MLTWEGGKAGKVRRELETGLEEAMVGRLEGQRGREVGRGLSERCKWQGGRWGVLRGGGKRGGGR